MNGLRTASELAETKPHGTRLKYLGGCRCLPCRAANSRYAQERAAAQRNGGWNGMVDAAPARKHLKKLSRRGVGYKAVAEAADVAKSIVFKIRTGERRQIRKQTADRILGVTAAAVADRGIVDASPTWQRINWLLAEGFTKTALAQRLGFARAIQFKKDRITARNAAKVERFYNMIRAGE